MIHSSSGQCSVMKIKEIRAVTLDIPRQTPKTQARRPNANKVAADRALPINFYPEFTRRFGCMPGAGAPDVWVQVIAKDGTSGLGACSYGEPVAAMKARRAAQRNSES